MNLEDKFEIRRQALKRLVDQIGHGGIKKVAEAIGCEPSYVSRMLFDPKQKGARTITERFADLLNQTYPGWLPDDVINEHRPMYHRIDIQPRQNAASVPVIFTFCMLSSTWTPVQDNCRTQKDTPMLAFHTEDPDAYAVKAIGNPIVNFFGIGKAFIIEPNTTPQPGNWVWCETRDGRATIARLSADHPDAVILQPLDGTSAFTESRDALSAIHFIRAVIQT